MERCRLPGRSRSVACQALGIKHSRTRPYRPRTNGKAERFIRTMLGGWAYGAIYGNSRERTAALHGWLDYYNRRRPHGSLSHQPPLTRLHAIRNNVPGSLHLEVDPPEQHTAIVAAETHRVDRKSVV